MTVRRRSLTLASFALFSLLGSPAIQGQQTSSSTGASQPKAAPIKADDDVVVVNEKREELEREHSRVNRELSELLGQRASIQNDAIRAKDSAEFNQREADNLSREIEAAKASNADPARLAELDQKLKFFESMRDTAQRDLDRITDLEKRIKDKQDEVDQVSVELAAVDRRLAQLVNFEKERNSFRKLISGVFCALVGVVIIGFFFLAQKKEIAEDIFSGEKGIQFITLFLIVIAIILFGILGILEGKELSALLGAISGYILGRASSRNAVEPAVARDLPRVVDAGGSVEHPAPAHG